MLKSLRLQPLLAKIAVGYMVKIVIISGIAYVGICEWKETKAREMVSDCSTTSCVFDFLLRCTPL